MIMKNEDRIKPGRKKTHALELPVYDSLSQMAGATGIPLAKLKHAKRSGSLFVQHGRASLHEFLRWNFQQKPGSQKIDVADERAQIARLERMKLQREQKIEDGRLVDGIALEERIKTELLAPFKSELLATARRHGFEKHVLELFEKFRDKP